MITSSMCPSPPPLYLYVYQKQWNRCLERCISHPEEAKFLDDEQCSPLHIACYCSDPPISVIQALIAANRASTSIPNKWNRTPRHIAVDLASPGVVRALLNANPSCALLRGTMNTYPLTYLCWWHKGRIIKALKECHCSKYSHAKHQQLRRSLQRDPLLQSLWWKACMLAKAMYQPVVPTNHSALQYGAELEEELETGVIHACCAIDQCPDILLRFATTLRPHDLHLPDVHGNLPLHIVAISPYTATQMVMESKPFHLLPYILSLNPNAAKIRNVNGDVPLTLALRTGTKLWNEGIDDLVNAFPGALTIMDKGFYPFMIAAAASTAAATIHTNTSSRINADNHSQLCSVYSMLRACPELERFQK